MSDTPLLDTFADMTAASLARAGLVEREVMLVRIAALAAVGAPPASYLLNLGAAAEIGLTLEDVQGVLVAVAPVTGGPKVVAASGAIFKALGFAIDVLKTRRTSTRSSPAAHRRQPPVTAARRAPGGSSRGSTSPARP